MQATPIAVAPRRSLSSRVSPNQVTGILLLLFAAELVFWVLFRLVNLDEGWYLWAAKEVFAGRQLYGDFAYTQTPLLPYVYGLAQLVLGQSLYAGRALTAGFGFAAGVLGMATARRIAGPWAGVFALALLLTTFLAITAFGYTATYGLTSLLLAAAFYLAARLQPGSRRTWLVIGCLALATAGRLAVVVVFLPIAVFLIFTSPRSRRLRTAVELSIAAVLLLVLLLGPFALASGQQMTYDIFGFHMDRMLAEWRRERLLTTLWETLRDFSVPVLVYLAAVVDLCFRVLQHRADWRAALRPYALEITLAASIALLFLAHLVPRTAMSYYSALQVPLIAILFGALAVRWLRGNRPRLAAALLAVLLLVQLVTQARIVRYYGLTTWPPTSQVDVVRAAAETLRQVVPPGGEVLTFDTHLALEAGLDMPSGYEMSIFSYRPSWTTEQAQQYRVINNELLLSDLERGVDAVALTQFDEDLLYGDRDALFAAIYGKYRLAYSVPGFDPFHNDLHIYLPPQGVLPDSATVLDQRFGDAIRLAGYEPGSQSLRPGEPLTLALYWQPVSGASQPKDATVFVHLLDKDEVVLAGQDSQPCQGTCPASTWRPGEVIRDEHRLTLPADMPPGDYLIEIGMYDPQTLERLPVSGSGDRLLLARYACQPTTGGKTVQCVAEALN